MDENREMKEGNCKYHLKDVAELHNDTILKDNMMFSTVLLSKEVHNDERCIVACSFSNEKLGQQLHIIDATNDELIKSKIVHKKTMAKILTSFDVFLISCSVPGDVVIIDARTGSVVKKLAITDYEVANMCVHGNSKHSEPLQIVFTKVGDHIVYVMDIASKSVQCEMEGHVGYITTIQVVEQISPNNSTLIISTSEDMTCRSWYLDTGKEKKRFQT